VTRRSDGAAPDLIVTNTEQPVVIPHEDLRPETLHRLIEIFVGREGTNYGPREWTLEEKVGHVIRQLERGEALVVYDAESGTTNIIPLPGTK
jgi:uncharacterized protein YheU (UPF0270 family)